MDRRGMPSSLRARKDATATDVWGMVEQERIKAGEIDARRGGGKKEG